MPGLPLRRQPLNFPHDDPDLRWSVYCEGYSVGVIVQHQGRSDEPRTWRWVMHIHADDRTNGLTGLSGEEAGREAAMAAFRAAWDRVRPAIGDQGWRLQIQHMEWLAALKNRIA
ncbi:hypothetical protein ASE63_25695 [Bosea sp. Root381]|uniref:hypothetical protein n=1 Tax=Bosea sp. Root381 TaxID=1736524 RepID=UPI0006F369F4|nr:hypothetical protein [Bosea sp. Root381]KRE04312.1 hypothetical protein ASE63_25695 [Bosea sp. Root381]